MSNPQFLSRGGAAVIKAIQGIIAFSAKYSKILRDEGRKRGSYLKLFLKMFSKDVLDLAVSKKLGFYRF